MSDPWVVEQWSVRSIGSDIDDAVVQWSRPPRLGDRLVLLLHGLGSNELDLLGLLPGLPDDLVYASLRGIFGYFEGYAWLDADMDASRPAKIQASAAAVERWLASQTELVPVGAIGFSQGAMLALQLLRRNPEVFDWVAQLSGGPFSMQLPADAELERLRPPAFWGHGDLDPIFDLAYAEGVRAWMSTHTTLTEMRDPLLGHSCSAAELAALGRFIAAQH